MSKKTLLILILTITLVFLAVFGFLYFSNTATNKDSSTSTNFLSDFLPFGKNNNTNPTQENPADISGFVGTNQNEPEEARAKLVKISAAPVAGFGIFSKEVYQDIWSTAPVTATTETPAEETEEQMEEEQPAVAPTAPEIIFTPIVKYMDRITGNIYETSLDSLSTKKITTTIIPQVYDAYFGNNGESVAMRYLKADNKTIETFTGTLPKEFLGGDTADTQIKGSFLPENIFDISISPDFKKMFYLFEIESGSLGTTAGFAGENKMQVLDSAFSEWISQWPNSRMLTITTRPASKYPGYAYSIDPDKKTVSKILGGVDGLTTLTSPNGKLVLYGNEELNLSIYNINTGGTNALGIKTLPEKCTWNKNSELIYCAVPKFLENFPYPEAWYQGEISFGDQLWKIDAMNNATTMLVNPTAVEGGEEIDGIKLATDGAENYLLFINKKDSALWKLDLK